MSKKAGLDTSHPHFDLIVIGAGINGTGIARDAAIRGLRVLLLDKGDVCAGTSAWSSRLIHGGLRYLAHGEISLVRESLHERHYLMRNAPHLVQPLPFTIPFYSCWDAFSVPIGLRLYESLARNDNLLTHRRLSRRRLVKEIPGINTTHLKGGASYIDGQAPQAERLCVENALSAVQHGATLMTYARVDEFIIEGNTIKGVVYSPLLGPSRGQQRAHASLVINAAGPWVDEVLAKGASTKTPLMGGTKGSHLVVAPFEGAPQSALYFKAPQDKRPLFILPWGELYLLGTTDKRYQGNIDDVHATDEEINYILQATNHVLPSAKLTREQVLYTYAGVRPLPRDPSGKTGAITRRHILHDHAPEYDGLLSIIGGKLTTYRHLSEEAVDLAFKKLGKVAPPCHTALIALPGAQVADFAAFKTWFLAHAPFPPAVRSRLVNLYGTRSLALWQLCKQTPSLNEMLCEHPAAIKAEVVFAFQHEMAKTLSDMLLRRSLVGLGENLGKGTDELAAEIAIEHLGWGEKHAASEVESYRQFVKIFFRA